MNNTQVITQALKFLSARCDGAYKRDGAGFNSFDARFGNSLAEQAPDLTPSQIESAHKLLQKYQGQLQIAGIELPEQIDVKKVRESEPYQIDIKADDGLILAYFSEKPTQEDRELLDEFEGRRWNPDRDGVPWEIPTRHAQKVRAIFGGRNDVMIDQSVIDLSEQKITAMEKIDITDIDEGGTVLIYFGRKPTSAERTMLDRLPERKWQPEMENQPWITPGRHAIWIKKMFPTFDTTEKFDQFVERQEQLAKLARMKSEPITETKHEMDERLFPFQKTGIKFIEQSNGRCLVADQMGLGKTIQSLEWLKRN